MSILTYIIVIITFLSKFSIMILQKKKVTENRSCYKNVHHYFGNQNRKTWSSCLFIHVSLEAFFPLPKMTAEIKQKTHVRVCNK